ncbi:hypothetical protein FKP32DRAFT_1670965 [Trametes sanguinea]|nr:hypothetical protein FKP32DRAFT_1670965 [Trametes sanguinea]
MAMQAQRVPTIPPTPSNDPWLSPLAFLSKFMLALRRVWDEVCLATCRSLRVRYPNGCVVLYDRSEVALTGPAVSSPIFPILQHLGHHVFQTVTLNVVESLDGGETTFAWRTTVGVTSVIMKSDLMTTDDWTEREVTKEWIRLAFALPRNARVASALPIPAYHGLFQGARESIILMSDCGDPITNFPDVQDELRRAQFEAIAEMENAGVVVQDIAARNTVFDGRRVRIIDFV